MKHSVYITWAKRQAAARYNLANSGILGCEAGDLPFEPGDVALSGENSEGYLPLRQAIASKYGAQVEQVVLAQGTSFANFLACATVLARGDEALVEQPVYEPLLATILFLGAGVRRFARRMEDGFGLDADEVRRRMTRRTRLIVLTSPHNPSGVTADPAALAEVGEIAERAGARVLVDEVYRDILFEDAPPSAWHAGEPFIATSSLTKSYGLSGLRCGWVLCDAATAERMRRLNDVMGVAGPMPAESLGLAAFRRLPALEARSRAIVEPNARLVREFLAAHDDLLECVVPARSIVVFPRLRRAASSDALHDRLRARETSIVPGRFFDAPRHFRLGFAVRTEDVAEGLKRLSEVLRTMETGAFSS
jgi:aspartate/methionine/tyrosine aminotransferase